MSGLNRPALQPGQDHMIKTILSRFLRADLSPGIAMAATVNAVAGGNTKMSAKNIDAAIKRIYGDAGRRLLHEDRFPDRSLLDLVQIFREDIEQPSNYHHPGHNRVGNQSQMKLARLIWPTWVMMPTRNYPGAGGRYRPAGTSSRLR
jgi:hypothetical protein